MAKEPVSSISPLGDRENDHLGKGKGAAREVKHQNHEGDEIEDDEWVTEDEDEGQDASSEETKEEKDEENLYDA